MKKMNVVLAIVLSLIIALCVLMLIGIMCSIKLEVTPYTFEMKEAENDVKIALISDLHCKEYGKNNIKLVELIEGQQPDLIAVIGDMINKDSNSADVEDMCEFLSELTEIAPTYFSIGNHEASYIAEHGENVLDRIRDCGVTVLECEYEDLTVNGTQFRFGGMSELAYYGGDGKYDPKAEPFLTDYCATDLPKVMLSHRPEAFGFKYALQDWDVDLVLSGHTHGGLVRLPIVGGLFAPIQGMFPYFCYGEYTEYGSEIIITSGLAGYEGFPRMFNPPEICVVTLTAQ